jgi:hypothetical protein
MKQYFIGVKYQAKVRGGAILICPPLGGDTGFIPMGLLQQVYNLLRWSQLQNSPFLSFPQRF